MHQKAGANSFSGPDPLPIPNAGGTRFTSRLDVANYLSANWTRFGEYLVTEGPKISHLRSAATITNLYTNETKTARYNWGLAMVPVLERMRRLNGEGAPLLAHQVYTAMRELLHQLEAASISGDEVGLLSRVLHDEIQKRWIPHEPVWKAAQFFNLTWCECEEDTTLCAVHDRLQDAG